jgi:phosphonatase-like hydrolase
LAKIRLVVFDMAGTTVDDVIDGVPLVLRSYDEAFRRHGVEVPMDVLNDMRGRDKKEVIEELGGSKSSEIYKDFLAILHENTGRVREIAGASDVFRALRAEGVKVALGSGFPATVTQEIVENLGWSGGGLVDYWTCSEIVGENRPSPAMIRMAMRHTGVRDSAQVVKVDDTAIGIEEGRNAKSFTIAVLTGTQRRERIDAAKPDAVLPSVRELPAFLGERKMI